MRPRPAPISPEEYLRLEEGNPFKSEYVDGEIYAMSGAKRRHNVLAATLLYHAVDAARARAGCHAFGPDMKVRVEVANCFYYPDLCVSCDPDDNDETYLVHPCFIVEVLSPSTARIDRREKRANYLMLASLREYVMVDQNRMRVELCRREGGAWREYLLERPEDVVESSCLGLRLTLAEIYADVEFPLLGVKEEVGEYEVLVPSYM